MVISGARGFTETGGGVSSFFVSLDGGQPVNRNARRKNKRKYGRIIVLIIVLDSFLCGKFEEERNVLRIRHSSARFNISLATFRIACVLR